ncbi:MAG: colanic acid biosynthesis glycosyltransferase WcaL [bacterium]|nr:colanic acid biosynthesis glycosyltransferase WcaL [bacterium]
MTRVAYLLKKFPRLSETFVLGEILAQEALGTDVVVFSRRKPDDELRHPALAGVRAPVELIGGESRPDPWRELFVEGESSADLIERLGGLVRELAPFDHPRLSSLFGEALYLLRRTRELGVEHVHVHFATEAALVAMMAHELGGPSYSITAHAKDIYRSTVDRDQLDMVVERSAFTVTVCDANVRYLRERLSPVVSRRVRRLYNGIDLASFAYTPADREENHVLAVGRLVEKKGFDILLKAVARMGTDGVRPRVTIVGQGDEHEWLVATADALGIEDQVVFAGALDQDGVRALMREATVFCLPCVIGEDGNRDALPTVLLEALAVGLPCISTPVTGVPEILADGDAGVLVPERDVESTAEALTGLLADARRRRELAERGRLHAEQAFDGREAARVLGRWFAEVGGPVEVAR